MINLCKKIEFQMIALVSFCFALFISAVANAADFVVPDADVAATLLNLATNYKTLGLLGILSLVSLLSVQAIKHFLPEDFKYKRLLTLAVSIIYSIVTGLLVPGSSVPTVIITVFITSGGAMALYEALKGAKLINPQTAVKVGMLCIVLAGAGCTKGSSVGCVVEGTASTAIGAAIASQLQCSGGDKITADVQGQISKLGLCKKDDSKAMTTKSIGSDICAGIVGNVISNLASQGIPAAWGCSAANAKEALSGVVKTACEKVFP